MLRFYYAFGFTWKKLILTYYNLVSNGRIPTKLLGIYLIPWSIWLLAYVHIAYITYKNSLTKNLENYILYLIPF